MQTLIRVFIAEDDQIFRTYLHHLINKTEGMSVVGESFGANLVSEILQAQPDVVLMDIQMPKCDGLDATKMLTSVAPEIAVILLSSWVDINPLLRAVAANASGYIPKGCTDAVLLAGIRSAMKGEPCYDPSLGPVLRDGDGV